MAEQPGLVAALATVQADMPKISKGKIATVPTKAGGSYSYKYCDLAELSALMLPKLAANGLAWTCAPDLVEGRLVLRGRLAHTSGESIEGLWPLPADAPPQTLGGVLTYGRRYLLTAITGAVADDDDDAASTVDRGRPAASRRKSAADTGADSGPRKPTQKMLAAVHAALGEYGLSERSDKLTFCGGVIGREIGSSSELTAADASRILDVLKAELDQRAGGEER